MARSADVHAPSPAVRDINVDATIDARENTFAELKMRGRLARTIDAIAWSFWSFRSTPPCFCR
jgi:hypothetical protein